MIDGHWCAHVSIFLGVAQDSESEKAFLTEKKHNAED